MSKKRYLYKLITKYGGKYMIEHCWYDEKDEDASKHARSIKGKKIALKKSLDNGYSFNKIIEVYL